MPLPRRVAISVYAARALMVVQVLLGILLWTGGFDGLKVIHIFTGLLLLLTIWAAAVLGFRRRAPLPLVAVAVVWSLVMVAFGLTQEGILAGQGHVVIQVLHLLVGVLAVGLVEGLARSPGRIAAGQGAG